jgi:hypothetical protein
MAAIVEQSAGHLIVLDEFPYLMRGSPDLPSVVQRHYDAARTGRSPAFRVILCGSALSVMSTLLVGQKALRGRASLDLLVEPFDYRSARAFWGIDDFETAFMVDATVGGTPGYRDLLTNRAPASPRQYASWLASGILDPSHSLFREADFLLAEDPSLGDRALYQSVLGTIGEGASTRTAVAARLGKPLAALDHPLRQLERAGFLIRDQDLLRPNRPLLRLVDPLVRFQFAVIRPDLARFEARRTASAWREAMPRFRAQVLGPHFEHLARRWAGRYASEQTLGGRARRVGFAHVNDPEARQQFELDVVAEAEGTRRSRRPRILAIGEAKSGGRPRTTADLDRLARLRAALADRADVAHAKLLLFGRAGFHDDLRAAATGRPEVELIDLERLYEGD